MDAITLYLVVPHEDFYGRGKATGKSASRFKRVFDSRVKAEQWMTAHFPLTLNPFESCYQDDDDPSGDLLSIYIDEKDGTDRMVSQRELAKTIADSGFVPPPIAEYMEWEWREWWRKNKAKMTEGQRTALWRFIAPHPWRITEVEAEL